jgi:hypothetical protein
MCLDSRTGEIKKKNGNRNRRKSKAGLAAE